MLQFRAVKPQERSYLTITTDGVTLELLAGLAAASSAACLLCHPDQGPGFGSVMAGDVPPS